MSNSLQPFVDAHRRFRPELERIMTQAAQRAGLEIDPDSILQANVPGIEIVNASIKDLRKKTLAEIHKDPTIALVLLSRTKRSRSPVPNGIYVVKLAANEEAHLVSVSGGRVHKVKVKTEFVHRPIPVPLMRLSSLHLSTAQGDCNWVDWKIHLWGYAFTIYYGWC